MADADRYEQLCEAVRELHAHLQAPRPVEWEQHAARDAELSKLRLQVVELNAMLDDAIDERHAAERKYLDLAAEFDTYRRKYAAVRPAGAREQRQTKVVRKAR